MRSSLGNHSIPVQATTLRPSAALSAFLRLFQASAYNVGVLSLLGSAALGHLRLIALLSISESTCLHLGLELGQLIFRLLTLLARELQLGIGL